MKNYQIVCDIWEGNPQLNAQELIDNGVSGLIVRHNAMSGGLHMDDLFEQNYAIAKQMPAHGIYTVYNNWVSGRINYEWFDKHKPSDISCRIFPDIEVKCPDYGPDSYAYDVAKYVSLTASYKPTIYTAEWCLSMLSYWPKGEYWWAQYLNAVRIPPATSWNDLRSKIADLPDKPTNAAKCPGVIKLWQICDNFVIKGNAVDINVFPGTLNELKAWMNGADYQPEIPTQPVEQKEYTVSTSYNLMLRDAPTVDQTGKNILAALKPGTKVTKIGESGDWMKVTVEGYSSKQFLK